MLLCSLALNHIRQGLQSDEKSFQMTRFFLSSPGFGSVIQLTDCGSGSRYLVLDFLLDTIPSQNIDFVDTVSSKGCFAIHGRNNLCSLVFNLCLQRLSSDIIVRKDI